MPTIRKTRAQPERHIQNAVLAWFHMQPNCMVWHYKSKGSYYKGRRLKDLSRYSVKGVSDLVGIWQGRPIYIELKAPGKYPTKDQKAFLEKVESLGAIAFWARSVQEVIDKLSQYQ